jgi:lantibiotic modifying enzyme
MMADDVVNFSLCHGLAGNADILSTGSHMLGEAFLDGSKVAMSVASAGIQCLDQRGRGGPFGLIGSRMPGLLLGLSGVGHFYLRLYAPEVPSVLLPDPAAFLRRIRHGA